MILSINILVIILVTFILFLSRLSIIDLNNRSNQPFEYRNFNLTFNGEIYNFKELKNNLKKLGINLKQI